MPDRLNYLLGYGERLVEEIAPISAGGPKAHPYSFEQSKQRLAPRIRKAAEEVRRLPPEACPRDETVALLTLHPAYLAKSYYPDEILRVLGVQAVGSRAREIKPEGSVRKRRPEPNLTAELFVAGPRKRFYDFAASIGGWNQGTSGAQDLIKIEDFRAWPDEERLKPIRSEDEQPLLEIILHARPDREHDYIIEGFKEYLRFLHVKPDFDDRRFYAEGLCFLPLRVPREVAPQVVRYSFLRLAREMPRLRQFRPVVRTVPGMRAFACQLPAADPLDPNLCVAVFDGGIASKKPLARWVNCRETQKLGRDVPEFLGHGTAVTSALLFGPLEDGKAAPTPYATVDHYRVLDEYTKNDDQNELYTVLNRIQAVLQNRKYPFVNLSLGPDLPIDDNDVHAWTAVLDQLLSSGQTLAAIAVGNGGEADWPSGNARIQTPADCVNGLSIGACDKTGPDWRRAKYSSVGPGRSPGVVKPDALAFGGSTHQPYWTLDGSKPGYALPVTGTSFAAPTALRMAIAVRALFGNTLSPLALKALLIHSCEDRGHGKRESGWGRIPGEVQDLVLSDNSTAHIVYQGDLSPAQWLRMQIPVPAGPMQGMVTIAATFCFATSTDPQDPINYTRAGLEVRFRPHQDKRVDLSKMHALARPFFQAKSLYATESELRSDAHKWETTLHETSRFQARSLKNPVFDVHYNARAAGRAAGGANIPYALVVTVHSPKTKDLYNRIVQRYRTVLEPLRPVIEVPIRT